MKTHSNLITLKDYDWYQRQWLAGRCVAGILRTLNQMVREKIPNLNLLDMQAEAVKQLETNGCTATFKGYKGFPGAICLSVNKQLVHGIPVDYVLQDGDIVKFDLGATYEGAIADAAATAIYGEPKSAQHVELVDACRNALNVAIKAVAVGKQLGCIGNAIHHYAKSTRFGLVTEYGGHGIDENTPHAPPFVSNKSPANEGVRIQPGLTIAIEPMLVIGEPKTRIIDDGWTVVTPDVGVHMEHTIFVHEDRVEIMTSSAEN